MNKEGQLVDAVARRLRSSTWGTPAGRDLLAVASVIAIVAAVALWQPVVALLVAGGFGLLAAFAGAWLSTLSTPEQEDEDGTG